MTLLVSRDAWKDCASAADQNRVVSPLIAPHDVWRRCVSGRAACKSRADTTPLAWKDCESAADQNRVVLPHLASRDV
jgi:hypothetical protein